MTVLSAIMFILLGYLARCAQEYRFWHRLRASRRRQAQVAVDVDRILTGVSGEKPVISVSPLARKHLEERKMWRDRLISSITRGYVTPYQPRHAVGRSTPAQLVQMQTPTIEMGAITEE